MTDMDSVVSERWIVAAGDVADRRLDALRERADFLRMKIANKPNDFNKREYAALMWAIAELSGIGDELRAGAMEREQFRLDSKVQRASKLRGVIDGLEHNLRAMRERNASLSAENHRLRMELARESQKAPHTPQEAK